MRVDSKIYCYHAYAYDEEGYDYEDFDTMAEAKAWTAEQELDNRVLFTEVLMELLN